MPMSFEMSVEIPRWASPQHNKLILLTLAILHLHDAVSTEKTAKRRRREKTPETN